MKLSKGLLLCGSLTAVLSACGSTGDDCTNSLFGTNSCAVVEVEEGAADGSATQTTSNSTTFSQDFVSVSYNDNGTASTDDDTMSFTGGDFDGGNAYSREPQLDRAGMIGFRSDFNTQRVLYFATRGASESGNITVQSNITSNYINEGDFITNVSRTGGNTALSTGNATYVGKYAGSATVTGGGGAFFSEGDMFFYVEFQENGAVTGAVRNRTITIFTGQNPGDTAAYSQSSDIILNESFLNTDGIFDGGTTYVPTTDGTESTSTGTYSGLVGGPNGSEVGGITETTDTVTVTLDGGGTGDFEIREFGIFTGQCVPGVGLTCDPS